MWAPLLLAFALLAILLFKTTPNQLLWNVILFLAAFLAVWILYTPAWLTSTFWRQQLATGLRWLPGHLYGIVVALLGYYAFAILAQWSGSNPPAVAALVEQGLWIALVITTGDWLTKEWLGVSPLAKLADWIEFAGRKPTADPAKPEWFLVANQLYTFAEAQALASTVFQGRLATYEEVRQLSAAGVDWHEVPGWVEGRRVICPSGDGDVKQMNVFSEEAALYARFGVIVYGIKPTLTEMEKRLALVGGNVATEAGELISLKMQYVKQHRTDMATVLTLPPTFIGKNDQQTSKE